MNEKIKQISESGVEKLLNSGRGEIVKGKLLQLENECLEFDKKTGKNLTRILDTFKENCLEYVIDILNLSREDQKQGTDQYSKEDRENLDNKRTLSHEALISDVQSIERNLSDNGFDTSWAKDFYEGTKINRNKVKYFSVLVAHTLVLLALSQIQSE